MALISTITGTLTYPNDTPVANKSFQIEMVRVDDNQSGFFVDVASEAKVVVAKLYNFTTDENGNFSTNVISTDDLTGVNARYRIKTISGEWVYFLAPQGTHDLKQLLAQTQTENPTVVTHQGVSLAQVNARVDALVDSFALTANPNVDIPPNKTQYGTKLTRTWTSYANGGSVDGVVRVSANEIAIKRDTSEIFNDAGNFNGATIIIEDGSMGGNVDGYETTISSTTLLATHNGVDYAILKLNESVVPNKSGSQDIYIIDPRFKGKYLQDINNAPKNAGEIIAYLEGVTGEDRLSANSIKGLPTIPEQITTQEVIDDVRTARNANKNKLDALADWFMEVYQRRTDVIPSPQWQFSRQVGNQVKELDTAITSTRFSIDNKTSLTASIEYIQVAGGETDAGKINVIFPQHLSGDTLLTFAHLFQIHSIVISKGNAYLKEVVLTDTNASSGVVLQGTAFASTSAEGADAESTNLWQKQSNVSSGEFQINFKDADGNLMFQSDASATGKRWNKAQFTDFIHSVVGTTARTLIAIFNGIRPMIQNLIDNSNETLIADTAFTRDLTYTAAPAGDDSGDIWTGDDTSDINVQFALGSRTWTINRVVDDVSSGHIVLRMANFTDEELRTAFRDYKIQFASDGEYYTFDNYFLLEAYVADNEHREIEWVRKGARLKVGTNKLSIQEPITKDNLLPGGASPDTYLRADKNGRIIWGRDRSGNVIKQIHNGDIVGLNVTAINGTKIQQTGIGGDFRISGSQAHGFLRGEIELIKSSSNPVTLDYGGDDASAIITITLPMDRVARSDIVNVTLGDYGAKVDDVVEVYDGNAKQGTITAYIGRDATNGLEVVLVYTPETSAGSGNFVTGATLQLQFIPDDVELQHAGSSGRVFFYQNTKPTIDASWNIETLGTPLIFIAEGDDKGRYYGRANRAAGTTTATGYGRTAVDLTTSQLAAGVVGTKAYKGYNSVEQTINGINIPAGGTLSTLNNKVSALMLTYNNIPTQADNGQIDLIFTSDVNYNGFIVLTDGTYVVQLHKVSNTIWRSPILPNSDVTSLSEATTWSITAPTDTLITTTYSLERLDRPNKPTYHKITQTVNIPVGNGNDVWNTNYVEIWRYSNTTGERQDYRISADINARASWNAQSGADRGGLDVRTKIVDSADADVEILQRHNGVYIRNGNGTYTNLSRYGHSDVVEDITLENGQSMVIEGRGIAQLYASGKTIQVEPEYFDAMVRRL